MTMSRASKFEEFRYVGDKRTQRYYDLDAADLDASAIDELMDSDQFTCFGPDTPTEARNRGYRPVELARGAGRVPTAGSKPPGIASAEPLSRASNAASDKAGVLGTDSGSGSPRRSTH